MRAPVYTGTPICPSTSVEKPQGYPGPLLVQLKFAACSLHPTTGQVVVGTQGICPEWLRGGSGLLWTPRLLCKCEHHRTQDTSLSVCCPSFPKPHNASNLLKTAPCSLSSKLGTQQPTALRCGRSLEESQLGYRPHPCPTQSHLPRVEP